MRTFASNVQAKLTAVGYFREGLSVEQNVRLVHVNIYPFAESNVRERPCEEADIHHKTKGV